MQNDIDLSNDALLKHRAIAEKATPSFIQEGLSIYGPLHPDSKHPNGRIFVAKVAEGSNRRDPHLFDGAGVGSGPADAAHIAANSPDVVKAHVDEILRLRAEVERLKEDNEAYRVVMSNFQRITTNLAKEIDDNDQEVEEHTASLEAQIDWLAARCSEFCDAHNWCNECCMLGGPYVRKTCDCGAEIRNRFHKNVIFNMREAARKAIEGKE